MNTLRLFTLKDFSIPVSTSWYLADLGEFRGKQALYTQQSPQRLKTLREHVLIENKAVKVLAGAHEVQLVNYLTATGIDIGLLLNFGAARLEFKRKARTYRPKDSGQDEQDLQDKNLNGLASHPVHLVNPVEASGSRQDEQDFQDKAQAPFASYPVHPVNPVEVNKTTGDQK